MYGDIPLWATECGYHTWVGMPSGANQPPTSERAQGIYTIRTYCENWLYGIPWTSIYEAVDLRPEANAEWRFGIMRSDLSYKPAAQWLKRFLSQIGDGGTAGTLDITFTQPTDGAFRYLPLRDQNGKYKVVVWRNVLAWNRDARTDLYPPVRTARFHIPGASSVKVAFPCAPNTGCGSGWQQMTPIGGPYFDVGLGAEPCVLEVTV